MTTISIIGARGGIGTSTFAWAIARELNATAIIDLSSSQTLSWIVGGPESNFGWPTTLQATTSFTVDMLIENANRIDEIAVLSGGSPLEITTHTTDKTLVIDGDFPADFKILHTTNAPQDSIRETSQVAVMRQIRGGIPIALLEEKFDYTYKSETNVEKALNSGFGLHAKSRVRFVARQICADLFRNSSTNN